MLIKSVFNKDKNNYYCNIFLENGSYELPKNYDNKSVFCINYKCHITIELKFLNELILIKQVHQKNVIFVTIGILKKKSLIFNGMSATDVMTY